MTKPKCLDCKYRDQHTRGLCQTCYKRAYRHETLDGWPTKGFISDPETYVRWALEHYPDMVQDIAVEYGFKISRD